MTLNLCIDHLRKSNRNSGDVQQEVVDDTPSVECNLQNKERLQALRIALETLPDRQKGAVILRHIVGLPNPDISEIMGISIEAVESLVSRGKQALARTLAPQKKTLGLEDD